MTMNYKKGFIFVGIIDLFLLGLIIVFGFRLISPLLTGLSSPSDLPVIEQAVKVVVHTPEQINAGNDFSLVLQIMNPNDTVVTVREVILPNVIIDNMTIIGTDPAVVSKNPYDEGEGYSFNLEIPPQGEQLITFVILPPKMQAISTEVVTYTDNFVVTALVQLAVAP